VVSGKVSGGRKGGGGGLLQGKGKGFREGWEGNGMGRGGVSDDDDD
jgi:hypothetical protein